MSSIVNTCSATGLIMQAVEVVKRRSLVALPSGKSGFTFPIDVAIELKCTWCEAWMALELALRMGAPIGKRRDGRWFAKAE